MLKYWANFARTGEINDVSEIDVASDHHVMVKKGITIQEDSSTDKLWANTSGWCYEPLRKDSPSDFGFLMARAQMGQDEGSQNMSQDSLLCCSQISGKASCQDSDASRTSMAAEGRMMDAGSEQEMKDAQKEIGAIAGKQPDLKSGENKTSINDYKAEEQLLKDFLASDPELPTWKTVHQVQQSTKKEEPYTMSLDVEPYFGLNGRLDRKKHCSVWDPRWKHFYTCVTSGHTACMDTEKARLAIAALGGNDIGKNKMASTMPGIQKGERQASESTKWKGL